MRSCLLCGKPLSRIWVGSGEDFCSREHRNQYRMRRGMDRLLEANKISNVMRRREIPKMLAHPIPFRGGDVRMPDSRGIRIVASIREPMRASPLGIATHLLRVDKLMVLSCPPPRGKQREFQILRNWTSRPPLPCRRLRIALQVTGSVEQFSRPAPFAPGPRKGRQLRVSLSAGFRLPAIPRHEFAADSILLPKLVWTEKLPGPKVRVLSCQPRLYQISIQVGCEPIQPEHHAAVSASFSWPGLRRIRTTKLAIGAPRPRQFAASVSTAEPCPVELRVQEHRARIDSKFARVPQLPSSGVGLHRITVVPFASQDVPAQSSVQEHQIK